MGRRIGVHLISTEGQEAILGPIEPPRPAVE